MSQKMKQLMGFSFIFLVIGLSFASPTPKEVLEYMVLQAEELAATTEVFLGEQKRLGHGSLLETLEKEIVNLKLLSAQLKSRASLPNFENETVLEETKNLEIKLLALENVVTEEVKSVKKAIEEGHTATTHHSTIALTTKPPTTQPPTAAPTIDSIIEARRVVALANKLLKTYHGVEQIEIKFEVDGIDSLIKDYLSSPNPQLLPQLETHVTVLKSMLRRHGITE